jgi:hypothetical protein
MTKPLTTEQFRKVMHVDVPRNMDAHAGRLMFDVGSQLDEAIVIETPVDTGYLRSTRAFTVGSDQPPALDAPRNPKQSYRGIQPQPGKVLAEAVRKLVPFTTGFRANYATYVEDVRGMVKKAHARAGQFVRIAVRNAQSAEPRGRK